MGNKLLHGVFAVVGWILNDLFPSHRGPYWSRPYSLIIIVGLLVLVPSTRGPMLFWFGVSVAVGLIIFGFSYFYSKTKEGKK